MLVKTATITKSFNTLCQQIDGKKRAGFATPWLHGFCC